MGMENHSGMISAGENSWFVQFSGNPTSIHLVVKQEEVVKKIMNLALRSIFVHTLKDF
jgi:hypothetical protein